MSKLSTVIAFALGAAIGSFATYKILKERYDAIMKEETDSMIEVLKKRGVEPVDEVPVKNENLSEYAEKLNNLGYTPEKKEEKMEPEKQEGMNKPYVISPEQFGELDSYDTSSLTYYSDGVLTDDYDEPIEDIEGTVGIDAFTHFGEYEEDSVFIRNDARDTDYEILRDKSPYGKIS